MRTHHLAWAQSQQGVIPNEAIYASLRGHPREGSNTGELKEEGDAVTIRAYNNDLSYGETAWRNIAARVMKRGTSGFLDTPNLSTLTIRPQGRLVLERARGLWMGRGGKLRPQGTVQRTYLFDSAAVLC